MKTIVTKFCIDLLIWSLATPLAYLLRVEGAWSDNMESVLWISLLVIPVKLAIIAYEKFFVQSWHRVGLRDLSVIIRGVFMYSAIFLGIALAFRNSFFIPYSVPLIEAMLLILGLGITRFSARIWFEYKFQLSPGFQGKSKRVLIAGVGEAGTMIAREMFRHPKSNMIPIGFLDDDKTKQKQRFLGLPVLGNTDDAANIIKLSRIDILLIAMPSEDGKVIRKIVEKARNTEIEYKIIPAIHELISGQVSINVIRDVSVSDLLRRDQVQLNTQEIASYLKDRTILVTGAGGSIGSEIVRQIIPYQPQKLVLLERDEYSLYKFDQELKACPETVSYVPLIADMRDKQSMRSVFSKYNPDIVFHAAAYKHVPLMEQNPCQAILNNVVGTKNLVELALENGVNYFVNISTDKAVNPTSIMGASKRVAEYIVEWGSIKTSAKQNFVSVRFGNVLGSRGSVIPKFKDLIKRREPITITHPEMTRYFMTIPEASQLVLQAGGLNQNGSVYILEMGEPVKIMDLAEDLIRLSGLEPGIDIPIEVSGIRPGEKLYEELFTSEEVTDVTKYEKIRSARQTYLPNNFEDKLQSLVETASAFDEKKLLFLLKDLISVNELSSHYKEGNTIN